MDYPPGSPARRRRSDALQKFYQHYSPPTYPDPIYQSDRIPGPYIHADNTYEDLETSTAGSEGDSRRVPLAEHRGTHRRSNVTISHPRSHLDLDSAIAHPVYQHENIPHDLASPKYPKVTPSNTSGSRMPLASIPFFENLNTPSPPRRADHLINRKTRFEREMDTLAEDKHTKNSRSRSATKKTSALEGSDLDDKYVGPWVLGKVVGKGASGKLSDQCIPSSKMRRLTALSVRSCPTCQIAMVSSICRDQDRAQRQLSR